MKKKYIMKRKISLLTIVLLAGLMSMAQDRQQEGGKDFKPIRTPMSTATRFGFEGGVNFAKLEYNNDVAGTTESVNGHTSFHVGAFVNIPLGSMFRFQPGISYSGQGADLTTKFTSGSFSATSDVEQSLHYINVPLALQYQNPSGFFVELGAQPGFLISAKMKDISAGSTGSDSTNKKEFDTFDIGALGGIGYLTRIGLGFNVRYVYGLSNIFEDNNTKAGLEAKNRVIQVGLVYHLGAAK
jgi:urease beta subunit